MKINPDGSFLLNPREAAITALMLATGVTFPLAQHGTNLANNIEQAMKANLDLLPSTTIIEAISDPTLFAAE